MKIVKKGLTILMSLVLWAVILLAALFAFTTLATRDRTTVSSLAGYTPMIVQSDSMAPTFYAGDLIIIRKCDTAALKQGEIITFHTIINNEYALNTHRIDSIAEQNGMRSYVTKGDNNDMTDTHVISDGDIVGKYVGKLPGFGKIMEFLSSSIGFLLVILLPLLLFFIYQIYHLIMVGINLKKAIAVEEATQKAMAQNEADKKVQEAEAVLAEAKRLKAEAEAKLAEASRKKEEDK
ncbi:MAG: signal peptidase I [Eubacterium sp.]|nr:signal peptidase I [Eubacterium sp.]